MTGKRNCRKKREEVPSAKETPYRFANPPTPVPNPESPSTACKIGTLITGAMNVTGSYVPRAKRLNFWPFVSGVGSTWLLTLKAGKMPKIRTLPSLSDFCWGKLGGLDCESCFSDGAATAIFGDAGTSCENADCPKMATEIHSEATSRTRTSYS